MAAISAARGVNADHRVRWTWWATQTFRMLAATVAAAYAELALQRRLGVRYGT